MIKLYFLILLVAVISCTKHTEPIPKNQNFTDTTPEITPDIVFPENDSLQEPQYSTPFPNKLSVKKPDSTQLSHLLLGKWEGAWGGNVASMMGYSLEATLVVEDISGNKLQALYSWGLNNKIGVIKPGYSIIIPYLVNNYSLSWRTSNGSYTFTLDPNEPERIQGVFNNGDRDFTVEMTKCKLLDGEIRSATVSLYAKLDSSVTVTLDSATITQSSTLKLNGLKPHYSYSIKTSMNDIEGMKWSFAKDFTSDSLGSSTINTPMSLIFAMTPEKFSRLEYSTDFTDSVTIEIIDSTTIVSSYLASLNTKPISIAEENYLYSGTNATLYSPIGTTPRAIIYIVSSEYRKVTEGYAKKLAEHGFLTLTHDIYSTEIQNVPLQVIDSALYFLKEHTKNLELPLYALAIGRGTEGLLTYASYKSTIEKITVISPSSVIWMGFGPTNEARTTPSFNLYGKELPYVPNNVLDNLEKMMWSSPYSSLNWFTFNLANVTAVEEARIPIENYSGKLLLFSGTKDPIWPSELMSNNIIESFGDTKKGNVRSVVFDGAGHLMQRPNSPIACAVQNSIDLNAYTLCSNKESEGFAVKKLWKTLIEFYNE